MFKKAVTFGILKEEENGRKIVMKWSNNSTEGHVTWPCIMVEAIIRGQGKNKSWRPLIMSSFGVE